MPVFAQFNFNDVDNNALDSVPALGDQLGIYRNGATSVGGQAVLDGQNDLVKIYPDPIYQMDRGTLDIKFTLADQPLTATQTVLSRDSVGDTPGGYRVEIQADGSVVISHETGTGTETFGTAAGFANPGDEISLSYSWDQGGAGGALQINNVTSSASFQEYVPNTLTMDMGAVDQPWIIGAGQANSDAGSLDNIDQNFAGSVDMFQLSDSVDNYDPNPARDGIVYGTAGDDLIDASYTGDNDGDMIDANDAILAGDVGNDDYVIAGEGNDTVLAGEGEDYVLAGDGNDSVYAGAGNDFIEGGLGDDTLLGDEGDDVLRGDRGDDSLYGGVGNDTLFGVTGNDLVEGGAGDDNLHGNAGNDTILGGVGNDVIYGGNQNDLVNGDEGNDLLLGGNGNDTLFGGVGDDTLIGDDNDDLLSGGDGDDRVNGGIGNDTLTGGAGVDTLMGDADVDIIYGGAGDMIDGGEAGNDYDTLDLTGAGPLHIIYDPTNPENGTVQFLDADRNITSTLNFINIENVIPCFTPGTLIATPRGEVPVELLKAGDRIITRDNGIQEIRWTGRKDMGWHDLVANPHLKPVLIRQGSLGNGLPERDMMVSPNHRVLVANDRTALYFDEHEVLVSAKHLVAGKGIDAVNAVGASYIHFMFDRHEVVLSNGAWTESFQPGDYTLKGMGNAQRSEIFDLFPELKTDAGLEGYISARRTLKRHEAMLLVK